MAEERSIRTSPGKDAIPFGPRLVGTDMFRSVFDDGMALVEETADYLDGDGRKDSLRLTRAGAMAYASESMRLTTRLMQVASWLLLQRAVNNGEISDEQARAEQDKVRLSTLATAMHGPGWDGLPERLRALITRSLRLQERVKHLDGVLASGGDGSSAAGNPVLDQIGRIAAAFAGRAR
jgi:regulator of CtrA degradation